MNNNKVGKTIWIFFRGGDYPLAKILKKGFGHVYILTCDKFEYMWINPQHSRLTWDILPYGVDKVDAAKKICAENDMKCMKITLNTKGIVAFKLRLTALHCVGIAKYMCGINELFVQTPYQLYKYLIMIHKGDKICSWIKEVELIRI
ncbi:MAG: hypothetical protein B6I17_04175 [Tenericutes bacterium 4572_104]|nr:MAG: hypothetical protein B6I17_04175 [Tenericutes bacterium 4572_104]